MAAPLPLPPPKKSQKRKRRKTTRVILELSVKSCPVGPEFHPSFDESFPPGCCPQGHEILLSKDMKYLLRLKIKCTKLENIYNYSTPSSSSDWLKTFKKRKDMANSV
jgi:hypothetical protein